MSDLSNAKLKHAIDEYEGMVSSSSTIAALVTAAKELLAHRAARAADAERVRSVVRDAVHAAWPESKFGGNAPEAIAARAAEQLAGVRSDQREMDVACYAEVKRERDIALSECEKMKSQLAGAGVGLSSSDRVRLQSIIDLLRKQPVCWDMEKALLDRLLASPPAHSEPTYGQKRRSRAQLVALIGENAADNYISFPDNLNEPTDHTAAICALLDSDMPAGDLRKAMAELVGRR